MKKNLSFIAVSLSAFIASPLTLAENASAEAEASVEVRAGGSAEEPGLMDNIGDTAKRVGSNIKTKGSAAAQATGEAAVKAKDKVGEVMSRGAEKAVGPAEQASTEVEGGASVGAEAKSESQGGASVEAEATIKTETETSEKKGFFSRLFGR